MNRHRRSTFVPRARPLPWTLIVSNLVLMVLFGAIFGSYIFWILSGGAR